MEAWPLQWGGHHAGWGLAAAVASVAVALVGVLGALLGGCGVSHGALGLRGALDAALVAQALARVLEEGQQHRVNCCQSPSFVLLPEMSFYLIEC